MYYAIVENNTVTNIVVADEPLADNWFEVGEGCVIGDIWDSELVDLVEPAKPSEAEIAKEWSVIRADRNGRLSLCDWTQLPDSPVDRAAWAEYRQALRDITEQADPFNITWPTAPGA